MNLCQPYPSMWQKRVSGNWVNSFCSSSQMQSTFIVSTLPIMVTPRLSGCTVSRSALPQATSQGVSVSFLIGTSEKKNI